MIFPKANFDTNQSPEAINDRLKEGIPDIADNPNLSEETKEILAEIWQDSDSVVDYIDRLEARKAELQRRNFEGF